MNMIDEIQCGYGTLKAITVGILPQVAHSAVSWSQLHLKSLADLGSGFRCSNITQASKSNSEVSCKHIHN